MATINDLQLLMSCNVWLLIMIIWLTTRIFILIIIVNNFNLQWTMVSFIILSYCFCCHLIIIIIIIDNFSDLSIVQRVLVKEWLLSVMNSLKHAATSDFYSILPLKCLNCDSSKSCDKNHWIYLAKYFRGTVIGMQRPGLRWCAVPRCALAPLSACSLTLKISFGPTLASSDEELALCDH